MTDVKDLIDSIVDQKSSDVASNFNDIMKERISALVAQKKLDLSSALFGSPEGQEEPEVKEPDNEPKPTEIKEPEKEDNG